MRDSGQDIMKWEKKVEMRRQKHKKIITIKEEIAKKYGRRKKEKWREKERGEKEKKEKTPVRRIRRKREKTENITNANK